MLVEIVRLVQLTVPPRKIRQESAKPVILAIPAPPAAVAVNQDQQDQLGLRENQEDQAPQETPDHQANLSQYLAMSQFSHHANHAQAANPALQDHKVPQDQMDPQANLENLSAHQYLAHQAQLVPLAPLDPLDSQEAQESQETRAPVRRLEHPNQANQENQDHKEAPDNQEITDRQEILVNQDRKAHQDHPDNQETTDSQDSLDNPDSPAARVSVVFARNTVPSTEAFFTKMELAAKWRNSNIGTNELPRPCNFLQQSSSSSNFIQLSNIFVPVPINMFAFFAMFLKPHSP